MIIDLQLVSLANSLLSLPGFSFSSNEETTLLSETQKLPQMLEADFVMSGHRI